MKKNKFLLNKRGDIRMWLYIIVYISLIYLGLYLGLLGIKSCYVCLRLWRIGVSPIAMLDYGDEVINSYSFGCRVEQVTCEELDYKIVLSATHGGSIQLIPKKFYLYPQIVNLPILQKIPKWRLPINAIHSFFKPIGRILTLPDKIRFTNRLIEKYYWPNNELRKEDIQTFETRRPKKLWQYKVHTDLRLIPSEEQEVKILGHGIMVFDRNKHIEVFPKSTLYIGNESVVVYDDRLLVRGGNASKYWKFPLADSFVLILQNKDIPQERYELILQLYKKMNRFEELLLEYRVYCEINDVVKISGLDIEAAHLISDIEKISDNLGVSYLKKIIHSKYEKATSNL